MNLVVLASGRGSRLNKENRKKPKCLTKIYKENTIIDFIKKKFTFFKNIIVTTGYKSHLLKNHLGKLKIKYVKNEKYKKSNMVESLMLCKNKLVNGNLIIIYGDIFFDGKLIKKIMRIKGNVIPLNSLWLKSWKKRYRSIKKIKMDAEDVKVSKKNIVSIGGKIGKKLPKYQYMGIIKIDQNSFRKLRKFYNSLNDINISMTKFINASIKSKVTNFKYIKSKDYWFEVDNYEDLKFLRKEIQKLF